MAFFRRNIGKAQQAIRLGIGVGAALLGYSFLAGWPAWLVVVSALSFALSGIIGYCPVCTVARFGDRTRS
ncbi:YgaP family membrane protein [Ensifer sp.]|jgi:hypothetical protein|uniref:YgaP family membrane protein n=1 Tax=Ensifer sp. TaxID=1872086 RepID=UPI0039C89A83